MKPSDFLLIFQCQAKRSGQATTSRQLSTATFPLLSDVMVPQNEPRKAHLSPALSLSVKHTCKRSLKPLWASISSSAKWA